MKNRIAMRMLSILLCFVMLVCLVPTTVLAAGIKLETPQNLKLQGTVLSWDSVDNADFYGITLYHPNYVYSIGSWQTDGTSINLYKYLKDGETYGATVIACSNGSYQISTPAEIPLTACTNAGVPIYRDVNVVNGTSSASTAYPGMSVRLEAKPAPDGMVFDRWELSGGYINIGYSDTDTVIYVQAICDNDISARATYKYQENVTSAFTVQPQGGAALVGEYFDVTYAMNFTPQGTVKVQVEGNTLGDFTDLKQGEIDSASIKEDSVVTKTFRIMASDGTRNIYSDEFVVSWEDGPRFISQPMGGTVDHKVDFVATYALNFTPFSCRVERYNDYLGQWMDLAGATATSATISSYDFNTSSNYRIKAIIEGGGEVYSDEFTVTWSDAVSKFIQQPVGGTVDFDEDFTFTFAINFTPASNIAIQKYNSGFDSWDTVGYCTSLTSGTISGFASETTNKYRLEAYENGTPIHSNEFTVTWEGTDYTVTFDSNGGSAVTAQTIEEGQKATKPADPTKANYAFAGWYSDSGLTQAFDFNTPITGDTTIYAKWDVVITAANATVTVPVAGEHPDFNPISGDSSRYTVAFENWYLHESPYPDLNANSVFEHGKYYSLRIRFTPNAGYQFDSNTVFTVNGKATTSFGGIGAREYSATAYAATYTVTYDANGGTGSMAQEFLTHDNDGFAKNYTFPQCGFTAPAGQEFDKWLWYYESNPGSTNEITPGQSPWISGNIVVKALWKTVEYNVTVTGGTASVGAGTPITKATMGTTVTLTAGAAPTGQMFDKWVVNGVVVDDANSATTTFVMPAGNVTAEATYKNIPVVTYTVSFDANGGTGSMADATGVSGDYVLPVCGFTAPNGKQFKAWSVGGVEKAVGSAINVTANTTVTAIWEAIEYNVTVTGGTASVGAGTPITKATMGTTVTLTAAAAPSGQMFDKWVVNGVVVADANSATTTFVMPAGNVTAEATYKNIPVVTYTVSFDANGGTGSMADATGVSGDYVLPVCGFTAPNGKQFKAWSVGGVEKAAGDTITVNANTTVTAIWENIPVTYYTVTFDSNGGSAVTAQSIEAGQKATKPADPTKNGYDFKGWTLNGSAYDFNTAVNGDITLVATWEQQQVVPTTYTVSFAANGGTGTMADVTGISGEYTLPANGFTAPDGKQFKAWSVDGNEKAVGDKITVTADTTVTAVWETIPAAPIEYEILDGANSKWTQDSDENLSVRGSGAFSEFVGVKVDGKSVDEKYYTVKEGSTIVTLKAGYLNTLTVGSHTLEIIWTDGSASTAFTVNAKAVVDDDTKSPQTGDNSMMWLWVALLFVSGFGVVATTVIGKKKSSAK